MSHVSQVSLVSAMTEKEGTAYKVYEDFHEKYLSSGENQQKYQI